MDNKVPSLKRSDESSPKSSMFQESDLALDGTSRKASHRHPEIVMFHANYRIPGGEEQSFDAEAKLFERMGYRVTRVTVENMAVKENVVSAICSVFNLAVFLEAFRYFRKAQPTLIYVNNTWPALSPALLVAARLSRTPTLQAVRNYRLVAPSAKLHNDGRCVICGRTRYFRSCVMRGCYNNNKTQSFVVYCAALVNRISVWKWQRHLFLSTSELTRQLILGRCISSAKVRVRSNFNSVDPAYSVREGDVAIFVGRLSSEKGAVELVKEWPDTPTTPILTIVGEGPDSETIEKICTTKTTTRIHGYADHDTVLAMLRSSGVCIVPSQWAEPFGRVAIESMAVGTPVIYTKNGSLGDIVANGGVGVDELSRKEIAEALDKVLAPEFRNAFRSRAHRRYIEAFTSESAMAEMSRLISSIIR